MGDFRYAGVSLAHAVKLGLVDMAEDVEAALFQAVDKLDELAVVSRAGNHEQDLGSPKFDVVLPTVQEQKVLSDLVEHQSLANGSPFLVSENQARIYDAYKNSLFVTMCDLPWLGCKVQENGNCKSNCQARSRCSGADHKHHDEAADASDEAGRNAVGLERGPEVGGARPLEEEAGEVDDHVGEQEQHGADLRDLVQRPNEQEAKHQNEAQEDSENRVIPNHGSAKNALGYFSKNCILNQCLSKK